MSESWDQYAAVRTELEFALPSVTLLLGPPPVRLSLARLLCKHHRLGPVFETEKLTAFSARGIVQVVPVLRGAAGAVAYIINLDGATEAAQNILLKVLEEPPFHAYFILLALHLPLPTVVSRSQVHQLSGQEAEEDRAQDQRPTWPLAWPLVAAAVRVAQKGSGIEPVLRTWSPEHTRLLRQWAEEAASGRWSLFTLESVPGVTTDQARRVLQVLVMYHQSKNAAAVALMAAFKEEKQ